MKKLLAVLVLVLAGCCSEPTKDEVERERSIVTVVRERDIKYTANDPALTPAQKADVVDFWDALESWLQDREKLAGVRK